MSTIESSLTHLKTLEEIASDLQKQPNQTGVLREVYHELPNGSKVLVSIVLRATDLNSTDTEYYHAAGLSLDKKDNQLKVSAKIKSYVDGKYLALVNNPSDMQLLGSYRPINLRSRALSASYPVDLTTLNNDRVDIVWGDTKYLQQHSLPTTYHMLSKIFKNGVKLPQGQFCTNVSLNIVLKVSNMNINRIHINSNYVLCSDFPNQTWKKGHAATLFSGDKERMGSIYFNAKNTVKGDEKPHEIPESAKLISSTEASGTMIEDPLNQDSKTKQIKKIDN